LREEALEKERDKYFNVIRPVIPTKQEWRVKDKVDTPAPMTSNDDVDLLDNNKALLIKDGFWPPTGVDINMVFTLSVEFRGMEEEVAQMCFSPKEAVFEKPEESSQHLKPLYIRGHIDVGAAVNLMPYFVLKKHGREDDELVKTNLTLNGMGATRWRPEVSSPGNSP
jgi:hypothetical protein